MSGKVLLEFSNNVSVVSESVNNVSINQNSKTMKNYKIKEVKTSTPIVSFETPCRFHINDFELAFHSCDKSLAQGMVEILNDIHVKATLLDNDDSIIVILGCSMCPSVRYEFVCDGNNTIVVEQHTEKYYTEE